VNANCVHLIIYLYRYSGEHILRLFLKKTVQIFKLVNVLINVKNQMNCAAIVDILRSIPCLCFCVGLRTYKMLGLIIKKTKENLSFDNVNLFFVYKNIIKFFLFILKFNNSGNSRQGMSSRESLINAAESFNCLVSSDIKKWYLYIRLYFYCFRRHEGGKTYGPCVL
jgi:hypothetical protein